MEPRPAAPHDPARGLVEPLLTVVVPCYQEARRVGGALEGFRRLQALLPYPIELVVVDDGSLDGTADRAEALGADLPRLRVVRRPHRGKGAAVAAGVAVARGEWLFLADADWAVSPEQVLAFLPPVLTGFDIAIASREAPGARRHREGPVRHLLGRAFNRLVQACALPGVEDSQCGFKCFRREVARDLFASLETPGWAFDVEVLARARARGYRLVEVPVSWTHDPDTRVRPLRDAVGMAWDVLRIGWRLRRAERER